MTTPAFVQTKDQDFTTPTGQVAFNSNVTAGNLLIFILIGRSWVSVPSVSDSLGSNWSHVIDSVANTGSVSIWYAIAPSSGPCTVTVTPTGGANLTEGVVYEFSGFPYGVAVDQTAINKGTSTTVQAGPVTTTIANEVWIGAFWFMNSCTGANAPWVGGPTGNANLSEYQTVSATGSPTAGGTPADTFSGAIATFAQLANPPTGTYVIEAEW